MNEIFEQVLEHVRSAWRYRWWALATAWTIAVLGWLLVFSIPSSYQASSRVYIDATSRLGPLLQGLAVDQDIDAQLNLVRQALLSRPQLQKVAQKTDLDLRVRDNAKAREKLIEDLRGDIRIDLDRAATDSGDANRRSADRLYTITYENSAPDKALAVVQTLLDTFMEDTLGGNRTGSESAQQFLRGQIADYEKRLAQAEAALADFKKKNVGLMPRESGDFFNRMQAEIDAMQRAQAELRVLQGQRAALQAQLRGSSPVLPGASGAVRGPGGDLIQNDIEGRLQEAEARLDDALLRYTDKHPEVIALRQTIEELKIRRDKELAALRRGEAGSGSMRVNANPVYQSIQIKLNDIDVQAAAVRGQVADHERRIAEFRKLMNVAPDVEAELARLNRDYGVTKAQYDALVDRLEKARLSNQAEETGVVRFEVIDPPLVKADPVSPNRPLLVTLVFLGALAAGIGLALLLSQFQRTILSTRSLASLTGRPVIGAVTEIVEEPVRQAEMRSARRLALAGSALVALFALVLMFPAGLVNRILGSI